MAALPSEWATTCGELRGQLHSKEHRLTTGTVRGRGVHLEGHHLTVPLHACVLNAATPTALTVGGVLQCATAASCRLSDPCSRGQSTA